MTEIEKFVHKYTIIVGDVNSGKTEYTLNILRALVDAGIRSIAILDLAPEKVRGIGGKMGPFAHPEILYRTTDIAAPRLSGKDEQDILVLARHNAGKIEKLFQEYLENPREHLFINDVTLYLHAGSMERLMEVLTASSTVVINAYYGKTFLASTLSMRERELVDQLIARSDTVIRL